MKTVIPLFVNTPEIEEMMGRQIQIYFAPTDVEAMETAIREELGAVLLTMRYDMGQLAPITSTVTKTSDGYRSAGVIAREVDVAKVSLVHVLEQGYWAVDELRSPVVQLDGGFHDEKILRRGRLFYQKGYYGKDGRWVDKDQEFIVWAANIVRLAKRMSRRDRQLDAWVGPVAEAARAEGLVFIAN